MREGERKGTTVCDMTLPVLSRAEGQRVGRSVIARDMRRTRCTRLCRELEAGRLVVMGYHEKVSPARQVEGSK